MYELALATGLMLVLEGAMYALFPDGMRRMTAQIALLPPAQLRKAGLLLAALGLTVVAIMRSLP